MTTKPHADGIRAHLVKPLTPFTSGELQHQAGTLPKSTENKQQQKYCKIHILLHKEYILLGVTRLPELNPLSHLSLVYMKQILCKSASVFFNVFFFLATE